jgi:hypothetical protein
MTRWRLVFALFAVSGLACSAPAPAQESPLVLEQTIPLPDVGGRIDHFAFDPKRQRLFVAALGAGSVEAVDLTAGRSAGRIAGLQEPQGVAYLEGPDELAVATGGDGRVRVYRGGDLAPIAQIAVGPDADNLRVQPGTGRLVVGSDALVVIDPAARRAIATAKLPAHAEGFQLQGERAYVNLPAAGAIGVADLATGVLASRWPNGGRQMNFPLAIDPETGEVAVVYRLPARLVTFDPRTGAERQALDTCGDADDLFFDAARKRLYVVCGAGQVDTFQRADGQLRRIARTPTASGARTGLFVPSRDRLYVAAPARGARTAAILVLRPR